jgi:hypothetical protein
MNTEGDRAADNAPQLHDAIIGAREVLQRTSSAQWKLTAEKWQGFDGWMAILARGLASGDAGAIRQAAAELARAEPRRIVKLGSGETSVPMPEPTRERLNEVVHSIDRLRSGAAGQASDTNPSPDPEPDRT